MNSNNPLLTEAPIFSGSNGKIMKNGFHSNSSLDSWIDKNGILTDQFIKFVAKIPGAVYIYDLQKESIYFSQKIKILLGYSDEDLKKTGKNFILAFIHPDDLYLYMKNLTAYETAADNDIIESVFRMRAHDGKWKYIRTKENVFERTSEDRPSLILGLAEDITELKEDAANSKLNEDKYKAFVQYSTDIITVLDKDGIILFESPSVKNILGHNPSQLVGKNAFEYIHKDDRVRVIKAFKLGFITPGSPITVEYRFIKSDGEYAHLESTGTNYTHLSYVNGIVINSRNVTKRKLVEKNIRKLSHAVEQSSNTVVITNVDGKIEYVNKKFEDLTGYTEKEALDSNPSILKSGETDKELYKDLWTTILTGKTWVGELKNRKKNGDFYWESVKITPVLDDNDRIINFIAIKDDITGKKLLDEKLQKSLEEKELMLREIHHRVMNNLQIVNSLLNLQTSAIDDPMLKSQLIISQSRVKSMALIHQLLYKSKDLTSINLEDYLYSLLSYMLAAYGELQDRVTIKIICKDIFFSIETAVPFGLLVNELLTNSLRQGLHESRKAVINIVVSKNIDDTFTLTYNDNGLGVPLTLLNGHVTTFGMYLIDTLVSQIEGRIEMNTESGPFYKINFRGCNYQVKFHVSEHPSDGKSIYR